jgi:hypothetical protein
MSNNIQALPIGQTSTSDYYAEMVGTEIKVGKTTYCLVKSSAAISDADDAVVLWDSFASFTVDAVSGAAAVRATCAGIAQIPGTDIADDTYFWVAVRGPVTGTTAGAVTKETHLATHGSAGALDDTTVTDETTVAYSMDSVGSGTTATVWACFR